MFSGPIGIDQPDVTVLVRTLLQNVNRVDQHGCLDLTYRTASALRQAGYASALCRGPWLVPQVRLELLQPHPTLAPLVRFWYGRYAITAVLANPIVPPGRLTEDRRALPNVFRDDDSRRVLGSIARRGGVIPRRRLQQNQRRLPAARFNAALGLLVARHVVTVSASGVVKSVEDTGRLVSRHGVRRANIGAIC